MKFSPTEQFKNKPHSRPTVPPISESDNFAEMLGIGGCLAVWRLCGAISRFE